MYQIVWQFRQTILFLNVMNGIVNKDISKLETGVQNLIEVLTFYLVSHLPLEGFFPSDLQSTNPIAITRIFPHWPTGFTLKCSLIKPHCLMEIAPLETTLPNRSSTYPGTL